MPLSKPIIKLKNMSTGNFYNKNASNVFAVLMNHEQPIQDEDGNDTEETEEVGADEWEADDLNEEIKAICEDIKKYSYYHDCKHWEDGLRSYDGLIIGNLCTSKCFGDIEVSIGIEIIRRNGYYEGANLDWNVEIELDGSKYDDADFGEDFGYNSSMPKGMVKIQQRNAERWADKAKDEMIEEIE